MVVVDKISTPRNILVLKLTLIFLYLVSLIQLKLVVNTG